MSSKRKASNILEKFAKQPSTDLDQVVEDLAELGTEAADPLIEALTHKAYQVYFQMVKHKSVSKGRRVII